LYFQLPEQNQMKTMPAATTKQTLTFIATIAISLTEVYSQTDTAKNSYYESLSLKDLLNTKIISVSKKSELLFDAPLSASVITKEDIQRTGCNSIMEAMRLVPGVIVRQQSNGNYDIHLRGMDNVPLNASFDIASTTTLVMIDSRPIYSYLRGGTFWETLPVDINDVERIEVVRGPAAALYGPNAVNGVVNIITRRTKKDGLYLVTNNQQGSNHTFINNASIGFQSKKWSVIASGNYQRRQRSQTSYFEFNRNTWIDHPDYFLNFRDDTAFNISERFPDQGLAMEKYAGNLFLNYDRSEKAKFGLSTGIQHSKVQKISAENENTPLSTASSNTRYVDFRANVGGVSAQISYNGGQQNVDYDPGNKYDFHTLDANAEYNYTTGNFSLKPGLSYRSSIYDDTKYSDIANKRGIFNARGKITTATASLRAEYKMLNKKLRLVAGISANKFNYPDTNYIAFQFAATYKINKKQLVRFVYSRAPRSSNIFDTYVDQTIAYFPSGFRKYTRVGLWGNKNLKLLTADMLEVGYRFNISPAMNIDIELFDIRARNSNILISSAPFVHTAGTDTIVEIPIAATNLPLKVHQQGVTAAFTYNLKKAQFKTFITLQKSRIRNYAPYHNTPDAGMGPNHIYSAMGTEVTHKSTPTVFGGGFVNYMPTSRININVNAYYYSRQTYYHLSNVLFNDGIRGIDHINAKLIVNASISYGTTKGLNIFFNAKNILNDRSREFFRADAVPFMLMAGLTYEF
jgi:iron complex outermembrane recepter protein